MRTIFIGSLLLTACSSTELHQAASSGVVEGQITTVQGEPVAGATVTATARQAPFAPVLAQDSARSDATGHFEILLATPELLDADAVVRLSVRPPSSTAFMPADTSVLAVHFAPTSPPTDTARTVFRLSYLPD